MERHLPEQRLFLRSGNDTRFLRLTPLAQAGLLLGGGALVLWTAVASAILAMDAVGRSDLRDQTARDRSLYQARLNDMAAERDARAAEAARAQDRFYAALEEVSTQQSLLLDSEARMRELEAGIDTIQNALLDAMAEREAARAAIAAGEDGTTEHGLAEAEAQALSALVNEILKDTAGERDDAASAVGELQAQLDQLKTQMRRQTEQTDRILSRLEEAISVSMEPLDAVFSRVGLDPERILENVRSGYSGQGGPFNPITMTTKGGSPDPISGRASALLEDLDRINLYRIAIQQVPFSKPVKASFRYTSGFGNRRHPISRRWHFHEGVDMAGAHGTAIYATADGTVTFAGWQSGYGRLIKIRHANGLETRYGHLTRIRVNVGERVSQGERIGDMGSTGQSTGTHLHYEVRSGGKPVNPMNFIRAGQDVL
jgi:murein DD-endopeptidase MepM/ murein hydrolase activator NlpD